MSPCRVPLTQQRTALPVLTSLITIFPLYVLYNNILFTDRWLVKLDLINRSPVSQYAVEVPTTPWPALGNIPWHVMTILVYLSYNSCCFRIRQPVTTGQFMIVNATRSRYVLKRRFHTCAIGPFIICDYPTQDAQCLLGSTTESIASYLYSQMNATNFCRVFIIAVVTCEGFPQFFYLLIPYMPQGWQPY